MPRRFSRRRIAVRVVLAAVAVLLLAAAVLLGPVAAFHLLPPRITGEEARLAELLDLRPGMTMAEIGAGRGALSVALAPRLEPGGTLYSTELDPARLREIAAQVERAGLSNVVVVEAGETVTSLPDGCCDAIFMRNVYHHIGQPEPFNQDVRRSLRPGGRLAVIDFPPGAFRHLGRPGRSADRDGHGVGSLAVVRELEAAGFRLERIVDDWGGRLYLVLMRAPDGA